MTVSPSCPVLLIEDDASFRKGLVAALDRSHFVVSMAANGEEAIDILTKQQTFQVIILDLDLPKVDGQAVLDFIRDRRDQIPAKVIVVTGAKPELRQKYDLKLAEEVLFKPVDFDHVVARAQRYCV